MKRLIFIFAALILAVGLQAQDRIIERTFPKADTYYEYVGTAADTIGTEDQDSIVYKFRLNKDDFMFWDIKIQTDTSGMDTETYLGAAHLYGRIHGGDSWTLIDSTSHSGDDWTIPNTDTFSSYEFSTEDSTYSQSGNYAKYRELRLYIHEYGTPGDIESGDYVKVDTIQIKLWPRW